MGKTSNRTNNLTKFRNDGLLGVVIDFNDYNGIVERLELV